jgi:hypothetical protein
MPYVFRKKEITLILFTFKDKGGFRKKGELVKKMYKYLPVVVLVVLGCGEDEGTKHLSDTDYFPLQKGFYQVYAVHERNYQVQAEIENSVYQLKTEVVDSFANQEDGYTYTIHRSKRSTANDPWEFQQVWSVRLNAANVVVSEENVPFVKIVFPAIQNRQWDGNALNSLPADAYTLATTGKSYQLESGVVTGEYIQVVQEDSFDRILSLNKRLEVYARNIGLIYREITDLVYCSDEDNCPGQVGQQVIDSGTIYVQTLIEYGQN